MRISVEFLTHDEVELPWDYLDHLRGLFYQTMALGRPKLAQQVHEQGFGTASKHYKLATFSLLYPDEYRKMKHGMRVRGRLRWWIASPLEPVIEAIALGFLTRPEVRLGKCLLQVGQIGVVVPPAFQPTMTLVTLSPLVVSTGQRDDSGKFRKEFLAPHQPDFSRILVENLKRKSVALHGTALDGELQFEWLSPPQSKLFTVNGTHVRGWMMKFRVSGSTELIQVGYDAGFGERNAQGFGMVRLADEPPQ
jgi:CRISPR-associated endoribonuclease Cas6